MLQGLNPPQKVMAIPIGRMMDTHLLITNKHTITVTPMPQNVLVMKHVRIAKQENVNATRVNNALMAVLVFVLQIPRAGVCVTMIAQHVPSIFAVVKIASLNILNMRQIPFPIFFNQTRLVSYFMDSR